LAVFRSAARRVALVIALIASPLAASRPAAQSLPDPARTLETATAAAESALRQGELQIAESRYRAAAGAAWLLVGALDVAAGAAGRLDAARDAFERAAEMTADARDAHVALALVELQRGHPDEAVQLLMPLTAAPQSSVAMRRLLAQALVASGHPAEAIQELEAAQRAAPGDVEITFQLASGYLRARKLDQAERLFAAVAAARPLPETDVLMARMYRDAAEYARARAALERALKKDPRIRRAHYYLGTIYVMSEGMLRLDEAIAEFNQELRLAPDDIATHMALGMALVDAHRPADALPHLERVARSGAAPGNAYYYLGRCLIGLERPAEAVTALNQALTLSEGAAADAVDRKNIHYQLGVAHRTLGAADEAGAHFAEAERSWTTRFAGEHEKLSRYLADVPEPQPASVTATIAADAFPFAALAAPDREALRLRATATLARACFNLGIMHAQAGRFDRAAELLERAVAADPHFPNAQYSLGVAYFNARDYDKATAPLSRALDESPQKDEVRRMLALSWFNSEAYGKAADLLQNDPRRTSDASLQYVYGLALARSDRAAEAETAFSRLLADHADSPELNVLVGEAHAQQGDLDAAVRSLQRATSLKPDVADARVTLGVIYLKQGRLTEAADELRTELRFHADNLRARHTLATVLELDGHADEAVPLLRSIVAVKPTDADARYLLGKILLAQGSTAEAVDQLETAARIAPDEANVRYQLGQAYQKLGRTDQAEAQFDLFRRIKDKRRGGGGER